jgi:hypothetical protein
MAGQWKHGWIPISPGAVMSKNHGRKPGGGSKLGKKLTGMNSGSKPRAAPPSSSTAELQELAKTAKGRKEILRRQRERENALSAPARDAAARAGFTGPNKRKPHRKSALKGKGRR